MRPEIATYSPLNRPRDLLKTENRSTRKYAEHFPKDPDPFRELGSLFRRTGDLDSAATYFEKAHLLEPETVRYLVRLGLLRTFRGKFDAALQTYEKAQDAATTLSPVRRNRSRGQALRILDDVEQKAQPPLDLIPQLGRVDVSRARENADALEKLFPKYQPVIENFGITAFQWEVEATRGDMHRLRGECPKAPPFYEKAISCNPRTLPRVRIRAQKARCYRSLGQFEKAWTEVKKALRKVPIYSEALREKALIHRERGEQAKAANAVEEALRVYEPADSARVKARRIQALHDRLNES